MPLLSCPLCGTPVKSRLNRCEECGHSLTSQKTAIGECHDDNGRLFSGPMDKNTHRLIHTKQAAAPSARTFSSSGTSSYPGRMSSLSSATQNSSKKKSADKRVVLVLIIIFISWNIIIALLSDDNLFSNSNFAAIPEPNISSQPLESSLDFSLREWFITDRLNLCVNSIVTDTDLFGSLEPASNHQFLALMISIENITSEEEIFWYEDFYLESEDGMMFFPAVYPKESEFLSWQFDEIVNGYGHYVDANETLSGVIVFEVFSDAENFILYYDDWLYNARIDEYEYTKTYLTKFSISEL